jgi:uncharacterized protein YdeI (YjbR/CyaY-like superfamily)
MTKNPKVDKSFQTATLWRQEAQKLREILLECDLTEELKWGKPCYTHDGKNICIVQRMKDFLALLFFKGALLEDPDKVLEVQGPNSRSGYRMRFTSVQDVAKAAKTTKVYVREAIEIEKAGLEVGKAADVDYPKELLAKFVEDPELEAAFDRLTPGRKRGYAMHFSDAKQAKTRAARIEKYRRHIVAGKGVHDR